MKMINVHNLTLQFDVIDGMKVDQKGIDTIVEQINEVLSETFVYTQPQIMIEKDNVQIEKVTLK